MKTRTLLAAAMLLTLTSFAQTTGKWISGANAGIMAQTLSADNYLYYCGRYSTPTIGSFAYLAKADTSGNVIWEKYIDNLFGTAFEIDADEHSVYVVCYQSIFRFDTDGNLIWRKFIQGQAYQYVNDVMIDNTGGCVIAGMRSVPATPKKASYIVRFDSSGTVLWDKEVFWSGYNSSFFYSLAKDNAGNIYTCGGAGFSFNPVDIGIVAKFSPAGSLMWSRNISIDTNTQMTFYECVFSGNDLIVAGASWANAVGYPIAFVRMDTLGTPTVFSAFLPIDSVENYSINSITCTPYNTIVVTGRKYFNQSFEGVIMELDYNFNFIRGLGHSNCTEFTGANVTNTQTYVCGWNNSGNYTSFRGFSDYSWNFGCGFESVNTTLTHQLVNYGMPFDSISGVTILDSSATIIPVTNQYTMCDNLAGIPGPASGDFSMFPNPADEVITIRFAIPLSTPQTLNVCNMFGQNVTSLTCKSGETEFKIPILSLLPGTYTLRTENGLSHEFVIVR